MILLDTHVALWLKGGDTNLGPVARGELERAWLFRPSDLAISAVSFWEIGLLEAKGRIALDVSVRDWRDRQRAHGLAEIPLTSDIAIVANELEGFHKDPADRFLVATVLVTGGRLATADRAILEWRSSMQPLACLDARV